MAANSELVNSVSYDDEESVILSPEEEKVRKELRLTVHGKRTDIVHGRTLALVFGIVGMCGLAMVGISIYLGFINTLLYTNGVTIAKVVDSELYWELLLYTPLIFGVLVSFLCLIIVVFSLLTVKQAREFTRLVEETFGANSDREIKSHFGDIFKCVVYVVKIIIVLSILAQMAFVFTTKGFLLDLEKSINEGTTESPEPNSFSSRISTFQFLAFNRCCFDKGYASQDRIPQCPLSGSSCGLEPKYSGFGVVLCKCYEGDESFIEDMIKMLNETDVCSNLEKTTVRVEGENIPGTTISAKNIFEKDEVNLVGPEENDGCGSGLALGFQFVYYTYFYSNVSLYMDIFIGISVVQFIAVLYGLYKHFVGVEQAVVDEEIKLREQKARMSPFGSMPGFFFPSPIIGPRSPRSRREKGGKSKDGSKTGGSWGSLFESPTSPKNRTGSIEAVTKIEL